MRIDLYMYTYVYMYTCIHATNIGSRIITITTTKLLKTIIYRTSNFPIVNIIQKYNRLSTYITYCNKFSNSTGKTS